jgi:hypothetical protein
VFLGIITKLLCLIPSIPSSAQVFAFHSSTMDNLPGLAPADNDVADMMNLQVDEATGRCVFVDYTRGANYFHRLTFRTMAEARDFRNEAWGNRAQNLAARIEARQNNCEYNNTVNQHPISAFVFREES